MNKKLFYITTILFIIWGMMNMKYALATFAETSLGMSYYLVRILRILLISIAFLLLFSKGAKESTSKSIVIWAIYAVFITLFTQHTDLLNDITTILWWPAIYLIFYNIARTNSRFVDIIITYVFPIIFIINTFYYLEIRAVNSIVETITGTVGFRSSNEVFYIATLLPMAFIERKKWLKYTYLTIGLILVLYSFKRSALLYTVTIYAIAIYYDFFRNKRVAVIKKIAIIAVLLFGVVYIFNYIDEQTDGHITERIESSTEDGGSGRDEAYTMVIERYLNSDFPSQVLGVGFNGVIREYKIAVSSNKDFHYISAHNDFLEMLADFGFVGLLLYLIIVYKFYGCIKKGKRIGENYFQANLSAFAVLVLMGMVSHLFLYPTFIAYIVMVFGITNGVYSRLQKGNI